MIPSWLSTLASVGMAVGPPLVYVDQGISIVRKKDSTGFSRDVCAILLTANITRCFFWLGKHFELTLLLQSIFMIIAQLILLYICIRYRPRTNPENYASSRPLAFWQWSSYAQHIEFLIGFTLCSAILFLIFGRSEIYVSIMGFVALGLESTLPIPQMISNYKQRSLYGFRASTLLGWVGGDSFKFTFAVQSLRNFSIVSRCCLLQAIVLQRLWYGNAPPAATLAEEDDLEQALALAEE
ncbi:hypothetical protein SERLADRAFT_409799 [Serpula lacrymans var. lacrymans S7.9]|uniref:PQ-loop repeat-containing protein 1 n=1 Tax=Serpula lacrymans var. lacrymans (strain S7.9) TaxID=578457 RepID=F8P3W5_SERL9|nr:uncharacterized protein SERLADRAFT_409799 [Serpula lacrymans var. lacrymans S7.9]EGO22214.1 hypothetical protein SERLADRAFT_409799 [Serpula lacrymans var. lacrymans S7.9]